MTVCAAAGEFKARGSEIFVQFTESFTRLAATMDIGFEPVVCSGWPYSLVFLTKAAAPYVLILTVGAGLPCYIKWHRWRLLRAGKPLDEDDNIPLKQRMVGALVFVMYYLFPSTIIGLFKTFYCTEAIGETYDDSLATPDGENDLPRYFMTDLRIQHVMLPQSIYPECSYTAQPGLDFHSLACTFVTGASLDTTSSACGSPWGC